MLHSRLPYLLRLYTLSSLNSFGTCLHFWPHIYHSNEFHYWITCYENKYFFSFRKLLIFLVGPSSSHCEKPPSFVPCPCSPHQSLLHLSNNPFSDTHFSSPKITNLVCPYRAANYPCCLLASLENWHSVILVAHHIQNMLHDILQDQATASPKMFF